MRSTKEENPAYLVVSMSGRLAVEIICMHRSRAFLQFADLGYYLTKEVYYEQTTIAVRTML
jgi:hypothetical protein